MSNETTHQDNRPECVFCIAFREIRPRMYQVGDNSWRCPVCKAVMHDPTSDADAAAKDLQIMFVEGAEETKRRQEQAENAFFAKPRVFQPGPVEFKGGSKNGRKRKGTKKKGDPVYRWDRTFGEV